MEANTVRLLAAKHRDLNLIIDLGNLNYFGSEFIGSLVSVAREKKNQGKKVVVCNAVPQMKEVLENMGLFKLWPYTDTRELAIEKISALETTKA
jgi:anti-anti-sigma factor